MYRVLELLPMGMLCVPDRGTLCSRFGPKTHTHVYVYVYIYIHLHKIYPNTKNVKYVNPNLCGPKSSSSSSIHPLLHQTFVQCENQKNAPLGWFLKKEKKREKL
jgi:hypothetical protein